MKEIVRLIEGSEGNDPSLKKITPPEALRRVERGAISNYIIGKMKILSRSAHPLAFSPGQFG
jgi:hypothetical protein